MEEFLIYARLGFEHITDLYGFDHILFIVALCAGYGFADWKQLLILVTAFTLGHSLTLALAVMNIIQVPSDLIEFLIPLTIIITSTATLRSSSSRVKSSFGTLKYWLAAGFGLIHGMGFSNYLRSLLGRESNIVQPLFAFNIGLELGQLVIVFLTLLLTFIVTDVLKMKPIIWSTWLSGLVAGAALVLMTEKWIF